MKNIKKVAYIFGFVTMFFVLFCLNSCGECEHEYKAWKTIKAATCLETGTQSRSCVKCNAVETQTLSALGHAIVVDRAKAPTCTTVGMTEGSHCSTCGLTMAEQKNIPAKGHAEVIDAAVEATCIKEGKTSGKHCSVCNEVISAQKTTERKEHIEIVDKAVAATCASAGKTEGSHCSVCNTVIVAQKTVAKKTTHNYTKGSCGVCGAKDPNYTHVYGLGETWVVDGQWEFTVNSVTKHHLCNDFSNELNGYKNEQVVIVEYTYKNLGYYNEGYSVTGLYMSDSDFTVYDGEDESGNAYACIHCNYPKEIIAGMKCTVKTDFVLNNKSSTITLTLEHGTTNGMGKQYAIFKVPVK